MDANDHMEEHQLALLHEIEDILCRVDALPTIDVRPADEILGYDEHLIPRGEKPSGS